MCHPASKRFIMLIPLVAGLWASLWSGGCSGNRPVRQAGHHASGDVARRLYRETAAQSVEQVVVDLGQFFAKADSCQRNTQYAANELEGWALTIPCNIKVRRLVEEGRRDPDLVATLLNNQIAAELAGYPAARDAWIAYMARYRRGDAPPPSISADDATYRSTRHYADPIFELDRVNYVIQAALYILGDIGRLNAHTLAAWVAQDQPPELRCRELEVWLVHVLLASKPPHGSGPARGLAETASRMTVPVTRRPFPRWDADADTAAQEPFEMLDLPVALPIDPALADRLLQQLVAATAAE